ncbi:hypothetical protein [Sphingomonas turrisvirgatae]|uniref:Uncharacterized protein n=1 Tax=Sphingomonas turrisvirgatae TaxID=1888892 RepID=A0A1E3LU14_9SPHN|nr:hypothetical protein [Sphingomonas turrisvirgatae]ODP36675.1 hypothetical protein BFL28_05060 [Sphingomonas turrisvirgatae]
MRALLTAASLALVALPGAALAGDKGAGDKPYAKGEAELAKMLEGRVAGKPVRCLSSSNIQNSTVIDKTAIVYRSGSKLYVNRPRTGATSLDDDDILVTKLYGSQLCNVDKVDLVDRGTRSWSGFVVLDDFVPYERVKTARR